MRLKILSAFGSIIGFLMGQCAAALPSNRSTPDYANLLKELGAPQCVSGLRAAESGIPSFVVANSEADCVTLPRTSLGKRVAFNMSLPGRSLRAVLTIPDRYTLAAKPHFIALRIIGGPGADVSDGALDELYADALGSDGILFSLAYSGTQFNSNYPSPDETQAVRDIEAACALLSRTSLPGKRILLVGESLGGILVRRASLGNCRNSILGIVTISSPMDSPEHIAARLVAVEKKAGIADPIKHVRTGPGGSFEIGKGKWMSVSSAQLFRAFFTDAEWQTDAAAQAVADGVPMLVVMGSLDNAMGVGRENNVILPNNVRMVVVPGMAHVPQASSSQAVATEVASFIRSIVGGDIIG